MSIEYILKYRYYMSSPSENFSAEVEKHPCKSEILVSFEDFFCKVSYEY